MKIAVCVKQVPDTWAEKKLQASDSTLDRESAEGVLNELDEYAVEECLRIAEAAGGEVVVVSMGPERAAAGWLKRMPLPELLHFDGWQGPADAAGEELAEAIRAVQPFPR